MGRGRRSKDWQPCEVVELCDAGSVSAAGRYQESCDHMARDGSWGDELCLLA